MRRLGVDLVERRRWQWHWLAANLICGGWGAYQALAYWELSERFDRGAQQVATLAQQVQQLKIDGERRALLAQPEQQQKAQERKQLQRTLDYPWEHVLSTVEGMTLQDAALLSFTHVRSDGRSQLVLETLDFNALSRVLQELNAADQDHYWYAKNYQMKTQGGSAVLKAELAQQ